MRFGPMFSTESSYLSPRALRIISRLMLLAAALALVGAAALVIGAVVRMPSELDLGVELADRVTPVQAAGQLPGGIVFTSGNDGPTLTVPDPPLGEAFLKSAGDVVLLLAVAGALLLLRPVLASIAAGHPFDRDNARRLGLLATVSLLAAWLAPLLPQFATLLALNRLDLVDAPSPFVIGLSLPLGPVILLPITFLVLAESFRQGERLHRRTLQLQRDVEGLV